MMSFNSGDKALLLLVIFIYIYFWSKIKNYIFNEFFTLFEHENSIDHNLSKISPNEKKVCRFVRKQTTLYSMSIFFHSNSDEKIFTFDTRRTGGHSSQKEIFYIFKWSSIIHWCHFIEHSSLLKISICYSPWLLINFSRNDMGQCSNGWHFLFLQRRAPINWNINTPCVVVQICTGPIPEKVLTHNEVFASSSFII
jgi:hypothetical protein